MSLEDLEEHQNPFYTNNAANYIFQRLKLSCTEDVSSKSGEFSKEWIFFRHKYAHEGMPAITTRFRRFEINGRVLIF